MSRRRSNPVLPAASTSALANIAAGFAGGAGAWFGKAFATDVYKSVTGKRRSNPDERVPNPASRGFRPTARALLASPRRDNPGWQIDGSGLEARLFVGLKVGARKSFTVDDVMRAVKKIRKNQRSMPDATFIAQKGIYTAPDGRVVDEPSAQIIFFGSGARAPFKKRMLDLGRQIAGAMCQDEVIVTLLEDSHAWYTTGVGRKHVTEACRARGRGRAANPRELLVVNPAGDFNRILAEAKAAAEGEGQGYGYSENSDGTVSVQVVRSRRGARWHLRADWYLGAKRVTKAVAKAHLEMGRNPRRRGKLKAAVSIDGRAKRVALDAVLFGSLWGVTGKRREWVVTHVPTGRGVGVFTRKADAQKLAKWLSDRAAPEAQAVTKVSVSAAVMDDLGRKVLEGYEAMGLKVPAGLRQRYGSSTERYRNPATSEKQRRLMGMALACKRGEKCSSPLARHLAKTMTVRQLEEYAGTLRDVRDDLRIDRALSRIRQDHELAQIDRARKRVKRDVRKGRAKNPSAADCKAACKKMGSARRRMRRADDELAAAMELEECRAANPRRRRNHQPGTVPPKGWHPSADGRSLEKHGTGAHSARTAQVYPAPGSGWYWRVFVTSEPHRTLFGSMASGEGAAKAAATRALSKRSPSRVRRGRRGMSGRRRNPAGKAALQAQAEKHLRRKLTPGEQKQLDAAWRDARTFYDVDPSRLVVGEAPPGTPLFVSGLGELLNVDYRVTNQDSWRAGEWTHKAGDHGRTGKRTKPAWVAYAPGDGNRIPIFVQPAGARMKVKPTHGIVG